MSSRFIARPLLPQNQVTLCCVSCEALDVIDSLRQQGIQVLEMPVSKHLPKAIASHADLQLLPLGGNRVLMNAEHAALRHKLEELGFLPEPVTGFGNMYPQDCLLNCLPMGGRLLCNPKAVWPPLLKRYTAVAVKQGYTRCSSLMLAETSLITDDPSICAAARLQGVLSGYFPQSEIVLNGYDHGFLGGCCGLLSSDEVALAGDSDTPYTRTLCEKLKSLGFRTVRVGNGPLRDIGGIIPLMEQAL